MINYAKPAIKDIEMNRETRSLGKTKIRITPIGLGCWQFSNGSGIVGNYWDNMVQETMTDIVDASLKLGINWFDTAEIYGRGKSEIALAQALQTLEIAPNSVLIATKWWPTFRTAGNIPKTIGERLAKLYPYPIDLYQIHQPFGFSSVNDEMNRMADLLDAGKIRSIGISNFSAKSMHIAAETLAKRGHVLASNQVKYSLLDRHIERKGIMAAAMDLGVTIIAYSPLGQGILTGKFHANKSLIKSRRGPRKYLRTFRESGLAESAPLISQLQRLAEKYNAAPGQIALNWLIHFHGETVVAIPGASKTEQAHSNAGALDFKLSDEDLDLLDKMTTQYK